MLSGISWKEFVLGMIALVIVYYGVVGWMYRNDLMQWFRGNKSE